MPNTQRGAQQLLQYHQLLTAPVLSAALISDTAMFTWQIEPRMGLVVFRTPTARNHR